MAHILEVLSAWPSLRCMPPYVQEREIILLKKWSGFQKDKNNMLLLIFLFHVFNFFKHLLKNAYTDEKRSAVLIYIFFFKDFFFFWCGPFFFKYWICYNVASILCFGSLAGRHVESQFPYQGSNLHPLHWKGKVLTTGPPGKSQKCHSFKTM